MAKVTVGVRLDPEVVELLDARGRRSEVIVAAIEAYLGAGPATAGPSGPRERRPVPPVPGVTRASDLWASGKVYRCPDRSCGWVAPSPKATCRIHGRRVVEA